MDGLGSSGGGGPDPKTRLGGSSMAIMVSLLLVARCTGDMTATTSVPPTPTVSEAIADPQSTTTTASLPLLVRMTQVLGGSLSDDTSTTDAVAVPPPEHPEESYMAAGIVRGMSLFLRDSVEPSDGCLDGGSCGNVFRRAFPSKVDFPYIDGSYVNACGTDFGESAWNSVTEVFDYHSDVDKTVESPVSFIPSMSGRDGSVVTLHVDLPPNFLR